MFGTSSSHLLYSFRNIWQCSELLGHTCTLYEICDSVQNFLIKPLLFSELCDSIQYSLITPSILLSKYVAVFGTSWSQLLYCFRNVGQCPEILDHTFSILFEIFDSVRNFLVTLVFFTKYVTVFRTSLSNLYCFPNYVTVFSTPWSHLLYCFLNTWQCSELLDRNFCTVLEMWGNVRKFLNTPSLFFSKYLTVFGSSWSQLYSLRNMWLFSELLDHTCTVFEIYYSVQNFLITPSVLFTNMWQCSMTWLDYRLVTFGSDRRRLLTAETWFKSNIIPCGICGDKSVAEVGYSLGT
jgi:hypothetical protein